MGNLRHLCHLRTGRESRNQFIIALISTLISLSSAPIALASDPVCPAELESEIGAIIDRPEFARSRWGISIANLESDEVLYGRDRDLFFIPASTVKLMTTAAALEELGPDYRIRTSIYSDDNETVYIVGRGDPSLTDIQLQELAKQLRDRGISQIETLVAEDGYFPGFIVNQNWEWEDVQAGYGAPVNGLILNQNSLDLMLWPEASVGRPLRVTWVRPEQGVGWEIDNRTRTVAPGDREFVEIGREFTRPVIRVAGQLRVGSEPEPVYASVVEPAANFLEGFKTILEREGIVVNTARIDTYSPPSKPEIAAVESPPLSELIKTVNLESNNVFTEAVLKTLGVQMPTTDATEAGLERVISNLTALGVDPGGYALADGSGLSRHNLVSPQTLIETLGGMADSPRAAIYRESLPVAGVSGTLKGRFRDSPAAGRVRAKTGTLTGVSALAGYVEPPDYSPLAFAIIVNQSNLRTGELRDAIDAIVLLLTRLQSC